MDGFAEGFRAELQDSVRNFINTNCFGNVKLGEGLKHIMDGNVNISEPVVHRDCWIRGRFGG